MLMVPKRSCLNSFFHACRGESLIYSQEFWMIEFSKSSEYAENYVKGGLGWLFHYRLCFARLNLLSLDLIRVSLI